MSEAPRQSKPCGICHTPIAENEPLATCPSCGLAFHADCWKSNWGCSAYGCAQVNALAPPGSDKPKVVAEIAADPLPWDYLLLGGSIVSLPLSLFLFGVPSMLVGAGAMAMGWRGQSRRRGILILSCAFALVGLVLGVELSYFWWLGGTHLGNPR